MKKAKKILLSALAVFSLFFTMTVNAEEVTPTKSLNDLTKEEFNSIIPDTVNVSYTKSGYTNYFLDRFDSLGTGAADPQYSDDVIVEIRTQLIELLENNNITYDDMSADYNDMLIVRTGFYSGDGNLEEAFVFGPNGNRKTIKINFQNESSYSADDEAYVKNKVNSMKFPNKYNNFDAMFKMYELGDQKYFEDNYDEFEKNQYSSLINDSSITVKGMSVNGAGGAYRVDFKRLYFFKNDVLYETKDVAFVFAYGTTLENGTPVIMRKIADNENIYKEMAKEFESKGLTNIIGSYELTAYGTTYKGMKVSFTVGTDYNGKEVQILHKKSDGTYETLKATVENGKVTITVDEFSPFMIALSDTVNNAPNNAQTSSINIIFYSILAISSLLGIAYLIVSKKKLEA